MRWLIGRRDAYRDAWCVWMGLAGSDPAVTPRGRKQRTTPDYWARRRRQLQAELGAHLSPSSAELEERQDIISRHLPRLGAQAAAGARSSIAQPQSMEKVTVSVNLELTEQPRLPPPEIRAFWGTFAWVDNPWLPDSNAPTLSRRKYDRIEVTSIAKLEITRTGMTTYTMRAPTAAQYVEGHTIVKLERWLIAIMPSSSRLQVGEQLGQRPQLQLRWPPKLTQTYTWTVVSSATITGKSADSSATITLQQQANGIYWDVVTAHNARKDANRLRKQPGGIVFRANPQIHGAPWEVKAAKANRHVLQELKKQPMAKLRKTASPKLEQVVKKLQTRATSDAWLSGQQSQSPRQLSAHRHTLTNYQVWVTYRMATEQLNLYCDGNAEEKTCPQDQACSDTKITATHIAWACQRAQALWRRWIEHWLGHELPLNGLEEFKSYASARVAPPIGTCLKERMMERYGKWSDEHAAVLRRMWWATCSIGFALLWQIRNQVVHEGKVWTAPQQLEFVWSSLLRQLTAVAKHERNQPKTSTQGLQLQLSLDCLVGGVVETASSDCPPGPAPWLKQKQLNLTKRLRLYQEAINKG